MYKVISEQMSVIIPAALPRIVWPKSVRPKTHSVISPSTPPDNPHALSSTAQASSHNRTIQDLYLSNTRKSNPSMFHLFSPLPNAAPRLLSSPKARSGRSHALVRNRLPSATCHVAHAEWTGTDWAGRFMIKTQSRTRPGAFFGRGSSAPAVSPRCATEHRWRRRPCA